MLKNYVSSDEITVLGNMAGSNISQIIKDLQEETDYLKFGDIVLLNKYSNNYYNYVSSLFNHKELTDLSNLLPFSYFNEKLSDQSKSKLVKPFFTEVDVMTKRFIILNETPDDYNSEINPLSVLFDSSVVTSVVNNHEIDELINEGIIEYQNTFRLSSLKYLVWY